MQKIAKISIFLIILMMLFVPTISFAEENTGLVPCGTGQVETYTDGGVEKTRISDECTFDDFIILIKNIINFITITAFSVATIMFSYAGFLYLTAGGEQGKLKSAHNIFSTVLIGLVFIFAAWLIVNTIAGVLLTESSEDGTNFLNIFKYFFK